MKKCLIPLLAIFLFSLISATNIMPDPFALSQQVGESQTYELTFNNSENFTILDFDFGNLTNLGFIFGNTTLLKNTTKSVQVNVTPTQEFDSILNQKVKFYFYSNVPTEVTTYNIEINENGFTPRYIILRVGDSIEFKNEDTIVHNVKSDLFDQNIQPNQTFSYTFQSEGEYDFEDFGWSQYIDFHGSISVISRTSQEKVHNGNLDFTWTLNINFYPNPTELEVELIDQSITSNVLTETEGLIRIKNTGSEEAKTINLKSNSSWISFDKNNFNLASNSQTYVTYTSYPTISNTNETNRTYQIDLDIKAKNVENSSYKINLFVPYRELTGNLENDFDYALWLENIWCPGHPCSVQCSPELPQCQTESGSSTGLNQSVIFNGTVAEFTQIKRDIASLQTESTRGANSINSIEEFLSTYFPDLNKTIVDAYLQSLETEEKRKTSNVTYWIIGFFLAIFIMAGILFTRYRKLQKKKSYTEGRFEYRN